MVDFSDFNSLISLADYFVDEHTCKAFLAEQRWGDTVVCPYCGSTHVYTCKDDRFKCASCQNTFSAKVGTIFEDTNLPLRKWFMAMYLVSSHKKGISSCQLARDIVVSQRTAWNMLQKIRTLYSQRVDQLENEVEMDEMYLGGRETNKHESKKVEGTQGRSTKTKTPIFGMAERGGKTIVMKVSDTRMATLMPIIKRYVRENSEVFTDELGAYSKLGENGYKHNVVCHSVKEFVNGKISTNSIEGFWGHFKRCIFGIYHFVSPKYQQRYIDEMVFRWNTRKTSESKRFEAMFQRSIGTIRWVDIPRMAA